MEVGSVPIRFPLPSLNMDGIGGLLMDSQVFQFTFVKNLEKDIELSLC
jgi:hypothetical protein